MTNYTGIKIITAAADQSYIRIENGVHNVVTVSSNNKGTKVVLKPGDMLVYRGMELEHWREEFQGNDCCQVFLHYNDQKSKNANQNLYDTRKHLGLPAWFKK